jgi:Tol biopolymer transport system component
VAHAAFSPDGRRLASAGRDKTAVIWDLDTRVPAVPPLRHDKEVRYVGFSPNGRFLVTGVNQDDGGMRIWEAATGKPLSQPLPYRKESESIAFSPDGRRVYALQWGAMKAWETASGGPVLLPAAPDRVMAFCFSADGRRLFAVAFDYTARMWDASTWKPLTPPMQLPANHYVDSVAFSPDGKLVAAGCRDSRARIWDAGTGAAVTDPLPHSRWVSHVEFSSDSGRLLTLCDDGGVRLWDARTGERRPLDVTHTKVVWKASFSPDGLSVLTASADHTAWVWDVVRNRPLTPPLRHGSAVTHAAFSPDGRHVVTTSWDRSVRDWDLAPCGAPDPRDLKHPYTVCEASWRPDGRVLTLSKDSDAKAGELHVWDAASGSLCQPALPYHPGEGHREHAVLSPDGRYLATRSAGDSLQLWDTSTKSPLGKPLPHKGGRSVGLEERADQARYRLALAQLGAGDLAGYRQTCSALFERLGRGERTGNLNSVAWVGALSPDSGVEPARLVRCAEQALAARPGDASCLNTLALALYRAGRFAQARQRAAGAMDRQGGNGSAWDWLLLALAQARLGRDAPAREELDQAGRRTAGKLSWNDRLELRLLRREGEALLHGESP